MTTENIKFKNPNDKAIELDYSSSITCNGTTKYNEELCKNKFLWHKVIVHHHNGKYDKKQILKALFKVVNNNYFFPIAYKESRHRDTFLVRQCCNALQELFQNKLLLKMSDNQKIQITILLNVANYEYGQIKPELKIYEAIMARYKNRTHHNRVDNVLNLEKFAFSPELSDIELDLGNIIIFNCLCETISKQHDVLNSINGFNLSNNNIKYLSPMKLFTQAKIQMIDLRLNNISDIREIENLKCISFTDLYISGNPIKENVPALFDKLQQIFPKLVNTDVNGTKGNRNTSVTREVDPVSVQENGQQIEVHDMLALEKFRNSTGWHKIIVRYLVVISSHNAVKHYGKYTKDDIIGAFFAFYSQEKSDIEFFPCYYDSGATKDTFLVRNCYENLKILMENDLKLPILNNTNYLKIKLIMELATFESGHLEQSKIILSAASDCFNIMERCLNLENFKSSKSLMNLILNMGYSKTIYNILLHCSRKYSSNIAVVRLNKNNISNCEGLKALSMMRNLKVLDLRDNNIKTINDLDYIPKNSIKEILIDGNPLCANFSSPTSYIAAFKQLFPNITKLDGILIDTVSGLISRKNYLCEIEYYDLVEQFVSNYFKAYDLSPDRKDFIEMYHPNAIFTISLYYDTTNKYTRYRLTNYFLKQRNLKTLSDLNNVNKNLYIGHDQIIGVLNSLPKTEHDLLMVTTDTNIIKQNLISITVTGVFKDIPEDQILEPEILLAFSRTFVISAVETNMGIFNSSTEYKILNDILYISAPTITQNRNSFKYSIPSDDFTGTATTSEEKELFTIMFEEMVGLKRVWCTRCLNDGHWNFKTALEVFMSLVTENQIPKTSFIQSMEN